MTANVMVVAVGIGYVKSTVKMGQAYVFVLHRNVSVLAIVTAQIQSFPDVFSGTIGGFYLVTIGPRNIKDTEASEA